MSADSRTGSAVPAESLFAAWISPGRDAVGDEDFEALCREHPDSASALRELLAQHERIERIRREHGQIGSLAEKLGATYGDGVDPRVTLEVEERPQGSLSEHLLARLAGRGPTSLRYRVKDEVAQGGMGVVLRVWDEDLRRHLAMKVMLAKGRDDPASKPADPKQLARFLEEAQVTGQLDHPGIVPVHELGLDAQGRVFFTMKLVKGQTLKEAFDELAAGRGGWTQARAVSLILKVCEAMSYAHAKGVIHRDLKPANIMVGKFGEVFVMDWGLARILGREDERDLRIREQRRPDTTVLFSDRRELASDTPDSPLCTMDGDIVGTPAYMSPEQARGNLSQMGAHSDVYAVGAMLYHLLAGHMPYAPPGVRLSSHAIWMRVQEGPPKRLDEVAPNAPAELVAICKRAMARDVAARYPDMAALAADLSAFVEGRVVRAYERGAWAEARKWVLRNRSLAAALGVALLLLVVGLVSSLLLKAQSDANADRADAKAHEAETNLELALLNERDARSQRADAVLARDRAQVQAAKLLRLSDAKVLMELEAEADGLWPPHPDRIPALEGWLQRALALVGNLPLHRTTLEEMRTRAQPWSDADRARDRATHPRAEELAEQEAEMEDLVARLEGDLEGAEQERAERRIIALESSNASLAADLATRRTWHFDSPEDQWQHDVLAELVSDLDELQAGLLATDATAPDHGWSVPKRLAFARSLEQGFSPDGEFSRTWSLALPSLREVYAGLDLEPQMGLVPIGPDPASGLWEFAHLMSGTPARRDADGHLVLDEETGMVLVLLRGGSFWMGAQSGDASGHNYDPSASENEGPVHEVELAPFFLAKHELTQGQWLRLTGRNPSEFGVGNWLELQWLAPADDAPLMHPVEQVNWKDCTTWLGRAGLGLPSEAQWEYAARGGTETPWWTGANKESIEGAGNVLDRYAKAHAGSAWQGYETWLDDGADLYTRVDRYLANPFGLHGVIGNLWEWCRDGFDSDFYARSPESDPVARGMGGSLRVQRGGSYRIAAKYARSSNRTSATAWFEGRDAGARAARALDR